MKTHRWAMTLLLVPVACGSKSEGTGSDTANTGITTIASATATATATEGSEGEGTGNGPGSNSADSDADGPGSGPKFDTEDPGFCAQRDAGIYCNNDNRAITCDDNHEQTDQADCNPHYCLEDVGCVDCLAGQYTCMGEKVMQCNDAANPPAWQLVVACNPANNETCDLSVGACIPATILGTNIPTGDYYQFAEFLTGSTAFMGGYDVDSFEDKLYVLNGNIDVYQVTLLDSDGDGQLEPNQHPMNPDNSGPIEQRTIAFVETIPSFGTPSASSSELLALDDRIYIAGSQLTENVLGVGTSVVTTPPGWAGWFAHIGYDDVNGVWYASNEGQRRVFQYCAATNTWGIAFMYPDMAGDHMDGMEVVTDPETGIPYVYVSDMTSDFIGQYRLDPTEGWVQENLFSYVGTAGSLVEGFGFGAFNHFWATGGNTVYELGGGDLSEYTDPPG